jgi:hypothetical protein
MKQNERRGLSFPTRFFGTAIVKTDVYHVGGGLVVILEDEHGECITTLSVNMPCAEHRLGPNEFFAKTWSENAEIAEDALASGIFRNTGRTSDDVVNAPIWTFK